MKENDRYHKVCYTISVEGKLSMPFELYTKVALKADLASHKLRRGDVATIVEKHPGRTNQETGYSLEVFNAVGETIAVVTLSESQLEPLTQNEVFHVRRLDEVPA